MIPERGTVYDFCFEKKASGNWIEWMDTLDRSTLTIPKDAKVYTFVIHLFYDVMILIFLRNLG